MDILAVLKQEEVKLQKQLTGIRGAIAAFTGSPMSASGSGSGIKGKTTSAGVKRVVSAALRAKLSQKAKERWARIRAEKAKKSK